MMALLIGTLYSSAWATAAVEPLAQLLPFCMRMAGSMMPDVQLRREGQVAWPVRRLAAAVKGVL